MGLPDPSAKADFKHAGVTGEGERIKHLPAADRTSAPTEWTQVKQLPAVGDKAGIISRWIAPMAHVVIPALVAGALWRSGRTIMAIAVASIATAITLASMISVRARSAVKSATEWLAALAGRSISFVILTAIYALIFAPVSLVLRLKRRVPLQLRFDPSRDTYWDPIIRPPAARQLYTRPFAFEQTQEAGAVGPSRSLLLRVAGQIYGAFALVAALLAANFLIGLCLIGGPHNPTPHLLRGRDIPAVRSYAWIPTWEDDYVRHSWTKFTFRPMVNWRHPDFESKWINERSGIRKSYEPATHEQRPLILHFFGGSTIWGSHQRDLHTIPSEFARIAEAHGIPVRVMNYGQLGYTINQEVALFSENCVGGTVPDVAVFYDGFNDIANVIQEDPTLVDVPIVRRRNLMVKEVFSRDEPFPLLKKYSAVHWLYGYWLEPHAAKSEQYKPLHTPEEYMPRLEKWYFGNARLAQQIGSGYGARVFSFLQPHYATKKSDPRELTPELMGTQLWGRKGGYEVVTGISQLLRQHLPEYMIDLTSALDDPKAPVMTDLVHHSELGAQMVAQQMFKHIEPALRAALRDKDAKLQ
jgi:hypothetical protein